MADARLSCSSCKKTFKNDSTLSTHIRKFHENHDPDISTRPILSKFELDRAILPTSGDCPICLVNFKGLRKHFNSCYFKENPKISKDISVHIKQNLVQKTNPTNHISKECSICRKMYIFKHTCKKTKANLIGNTFSQAFDFSDDYWIENYSFNPLNITNVEKNLNIIKSDRSNYLESLNNFSTSNFNNVKLLHLNINSLICKFAEIQEILNKKLFDIICLQETHISAIIPDEFFKNVSYNILRRDRTTGGGGGLMIFVIKSLPIIDMIIDPVYETITFSVSLNKKKHIFISSYNPHFRYSKDYLAYLEELLFSYNLKFLNSNIFLIGDLNMDLLTANGEKLISLMNSFNYISYQNKATHFNKNSNTCLDVAFCNEKSVIIAVDSFKCPYSDHDCVLLALSAKASKSGATTIETRSLNEEKLNAIDEALSFAPFSVLDSIDEIDDQFYFFKKLILDTIDSIAPLKTIRLKNKSLPWMDKEIRDIISMRDRLHTLASSFEKSHSIWESYRTLRNECKSLMRRKMKQFYEAKTTKSFGSSKKFWDFYKSVVKTKKSKNTQLISKITDPETKLPVSEPFKIANIFNKHFSNIKESSPLTELDSLDYIDTTFRKLKLENQLIPKTFNFKNITSENVIQGLSKLNSTSSCGISLLPVCVLKRSAKILAPVIARLFNNSIEACKFPNEFKIAICFPLFKKGDNTSCDNYRGINILPPLAKLFERLLSEDITHYFGENNLLSSFQHGFRANFSCETALQTILDDWKLGLSEKNSILTLFIDFKKAFDLLSPKLIFRKLFHYGFNNNALKLMTNYFESRFQKTRINNDFSELDPIENGVPQGSILGPLLFIIYINDLCFISKQKSVLFADDTTIYSKSDTFNNAISLFKKEFEPIMDWTRYNKLFINWSKTKFMFITRLRSKQDLSSFIELNGNKIELVNDFKLLGCIIDNKLNFDKYVKSISKSVYSKIFSIKNLFFLSLNIKLQFFKSFVLPHFDYCASLFIYLSITLINKIMRIYNNCLRLLFKIDLRDIDEINQLSLLSTYNLLPFKCRLFYRFSIFSYKIIHKSIMSGFQLTLNSHDYLTRNHNIYVVPESNSALCAKRLSVFLPKLVNYVLRLSINHCFKDFKNSLIANLADYYSKFEKKT